MDGFNTELEKCPGTIRDMYSRYNDQLNITDLNLRKGAYYSPGDDAIHINEKNVINGDTCHAPMQTAFHEWGHQIDHILGTKDGVFGGYISRTYKDGALLKAIKSDYNDLWKKAAEELGVTPKTKKDKLDTITIWLQLTDDAFKQDRTTQLRSFGSVSDILESQGGSGYPLGIGHGVTYWKKGAGNTALEFWAEYCDGQCNTVSGSNMRKLFPNACAVCDDLANYAAYGLG